MAVADAQSGIELWDVTTLRKKAVLAGHKARAFALQFSPDGKLLASGSADGKAKLWSMDTLRPIATLGSALQAVHSLAFSPDGHRLALGTGEGSIRLWDIDTLQEVCALRGHSSWVEPVFFVDPDTLVSVARNRSSGYDMLVWSAR
jgi:WD40 repeat protein